MDQVQQVLQPLSEVLPEQGHQACQVFHQSLALLLFRLVKHIDEDRHDLQSDVGSFQCCHEVERMAQRMSCLAAQEPCTFWQ